MESLKLDASGDLVFSGGNLQVIDGAEEIAQCCRVTLGTNQGEWFLDPSFGIAFSAFLGKHLSEDEMRSEITAGLLQEPRIQSVDEIAFLIDRPGRKLAVRFTATGADGETITEGVTINAG